MPSVRSDTQSMIMTGVHQRRHTRGPRAAHPASEGRLAESAPADVPRAELLLQRRRELVVNVREGDPPDAQTCTRRPPDAVSPGGSELAFSWACDLVLRAPTLATETAPTGERENRTREETSGGLGAGGGAGRRHATTPLRVCAEEQGGARASGPRCGCSSNREVTLAVGSVSRRSRRRRRGLARCRSAARVRQPRRGGRSPAPASATLRHARRVAVLRWTAEAGPPDLRRRHAGGSSPTTPPLAAHLAARPAICGPRAAGPAPAWQASFPTWSRQ
jgi:hypothetical protein